MVNDVSARKYDIALGSFRFEIERALKVDYTHVMYTRK